jgi:hypothetical protein
MVIDAPQCVLRMQRERANEVLPDQEAKHPLPASRVTYFVFEEGVDFGHVEETGTAN